MRLAQVDKRVASSRSDESAHGSNLKDSPLSQVFPVGNTLALRIWNAWLTIRERLALLPFFVPSANGDLLQKGIGSHCRNSPQAGSHYDSRPILNLPKRAFGCLGMESGLLNFRSIRIFGQKETVRKVGAIPSSGSGVVQKTQHKVLPPIFPDRHQVCSGDIGRGVEGL